MKRRQFIKDTAVLGLGVGIANTTTQAKQAPEQNAGASPSPKTPSPRRSGRMQSEWRWFSPPYTVTKGVHLFCDWRYVDPGYLDWLDASGKRQSNPGSGNAIHIGPYVDCYADHEQVPQGIAIRAQPARVSEPIQRVMAGPIIYENGTYRLWYPIWDDRCWYLPELAQKDPEEMLAIKQRWESLLLYAESQDGFEWKLPTLDLIDPKAYERNKVVFRNAVFGADKVTHRGARAQNWKSPAIFKDPHAPAEERYKMLYGAHFGYRNPRRAGLKETAHRMFAEYRKRWPNEERDPFVRNPDYIACVMGATSPDGLHWKTIDDPLALHVTDSNHVAGFDQNIGKYTWYCRRNWYPHKRRAVGRSESDDFTHFPPPEIIIKPELDEGPDADWYTPAKTMYPGSLDDYLLFPVQFRRGDESGAVHLFSSCDGIHWSRVPGGPVLTEAPAGRAGDCWIRTHSDLLPLADDRVGMMVDAQLTPHKFPRKGGKQSLEVFGYSSYWAYWPKGRLIAFEADGYGSFCTAALKLPGRKLVLNLHTKTAGEVRVEVAKPGEGYALGTAIPGRTFADCDAIHGDSPARTVTWRGQPDLGVAEGAPVVLKFRMRMAKLFSFEVV